jgi:hypothetical protein
MMNSLADFVIQAFGAVVLLVVFAVLMGALMLLGDLVGRVVALVWGWIYPPSNSSQTSLPLPPAREPSGFASMDETARKIQQRAAR